MAAVASLESNPLFNAGVGSVLNEKGVCEMEACVMDGASMKSGCVAGLWTVANPIRLALTVLRKSPSQFLAFEAAERFADNFSEIKRLAPTEFITDHRLALQQTDAANKAANALKPNEQNSKTASGSTSECRTIMQDPGETVGAVVCVDGKLACATSTGGLSNKMDGRIGDTPVIGAASYANEHVASSGTGIGEEFLRWNSAGRLSALVEYAGMSVDEAVKHVLHERMPPGSGGFIAVSKDGQIVLDVNAHYMARGSLTSSGVKSCALFWPDEY